MANPNLIDVRDHWHFVSNGAESYWFTAAGGPASKTIEAQVVLDRAVALEAKLSKMEEAADRVDRVANSLSWAQLMDALREAGYKWAPEVQKLENAIRMLAAEALAGGDEEALIVHRSNCVSMFHRAKCDCGFEEALAGESDETNSSFR